MSGFFVLSYDEAARPCGVSGYRPLDFDPAELWCLDADIDRPSLPLMRLSATECCLLDIVPNPLSLLIVSPKLQALIREASPLTKSYDANLIDDHDKKVAGFSVILGLPQIDCLDETRSEGLRDDSGSIRAIFSPWIDKAKVPDGTRIFRVKGMPGATYLDKQFAAMLRKARIAGAALVATADNCVGGR